MTIHPLSSRLGTRLHDLFIKEDVVSRVVVLFTWVVLYAATLECALWGLGVIDSDGPTGGSAGPLFVLVFALTAAAIVAAVVNASYFLVRFEEKKLTTLLPEESRPSETDPHDSETDQRHIAYAWPSGVGGMTLSALEFFGEVYGLELEFGTEDILLASSGLNLLVEEVKLRIRKGNVTVAYEDAERRAREAEGEARRLMRNLDRFRTDVVDAAQHRFGGKGDNEKGQP